MREVKLISLSCILAFFPCAARAQTALTWTHFTPSGSGPQGGGGSQSTAYDMATDRLIVFGAYDLSPCCAETNDVRVLKNATGSGGVPTWVQLTPTAPAGLPQSRQAHSAVYDPATNRMIIFGGGRLGSGQTGNSG